MAHNLTEGKKKRGNRRKKKTKKDREKISYMNHGDYHKKNYQIRK